MFLRLKRLYLRKSHPSTDLLRETWLKAWFILPANAKWILTLHDRFHGKCFAGVEHSSTVANYDLRICEVKICIPFAFAGSMNQALLHKTWLTTCNLRVLNAILGNLPVLSCCVLSSRNKDAGLMRIVPADWVAWCERNEMEPIPPGCWSGLALLTDVHHLRSLRDWFITKSEASTVWSTTVTALGV